MGAKDLHIAKWNELVDIIMQKRHLYISNYTELVIPNYDGFIVGDLNPWHTSPRFSAAHQPCHGENR